MITLVASRPHRLRSAWTTVITLVTFVTLAASPAPGATPPVGVPTPAIRADSGFTMREAMIPMRDGAKLYTRIFVPHLPAGSLPFLFVRTQIGRAHV